MICLVGCSFVYLWSYYFCFRYVPYSVLESTGVVTSKQFYEVNKSCNSLFLSICALRIYEEIQRIEANEFHYQEQVRLTAFISR